MVTRQHHLRHVEAARRMAREAGIPIMMHIGDIGPRELPPTPSELTSEALDMLEPGDIVTHVFGPLTGSALDEQMHVLPALKAAQRRGVWLDSAIGDYQFAWDAADAVMAEGIRPDTIASDMEIHSNLAGSSQPMVSDRRTTGSRVASERTLVEYLATFLKLGFSVDDIVRMVTEAPARVQGVEATAGSLREGMPADVSVLELIEGSFELTDVTGVSRVGTQAFVPALTLRGGVTHLPSTGGHAWGFAPPTATA